LKEDGQVVAKDTGYDLWQMCEKVCRGKFWTDWRSYHDGRDGQENPPAEAVVSIERMASGMHFDVQKSWIPTDMLLLGESHAVVVWRNCRVGVVVMLS